MRVLHITSHLDVGGIARSVLALAVCQRRSGHRVAVASAGGELLPELTAGGVDHWKLPLRTSAEFGFKARGVTRQLSERLSREPVDIIHAHTRVTQVAAQQLSRQHHIPYVATWHGYYRWNLGRFFWPCAGDRTIAISEPVRAHLRRDFRVPDARIRMIPHGIDIASFQPAADPAVQRAWRERLGLTGAEKVFGTVSRLVANKSIDLLVKALPDVRRKVPDAHLLVVGDGPERDNLEKLCRELGVQAHAHFTGTAASTRDLLKMMNVFVFIPSEQEGFGLTVLDAMASRRAIVSLHRGGGASWLLEQSGVGVRVDPGDSGALASAIAGVLSDPAEAERLAEQAAATVRQHYSLERMAEQVEALYRELTS